MRLEDDRVVGYNHASTMGVIGPGYFVLKETSENPDWTQHGSVVVDYYEVLDANTPIPTNWPKIKEIIKDCKSLFTIKCTTLCDASRPMSLLAPLSKKERASTPISSFADVHLKTSLSNQTKCNKPVFSFATISIQGRLYKTRKQQCMIGVHMRSLLFLSGLTLIACNKDTDGDGLTDRQEEDFGSDPEKVDSDDDGLTDAEEFDYSSDPNSYRFRW